MAQLLVTLQKMLKSRTAQLVKKSNFVSQENVATKDTPLLPKTSPKTNPSPQKRLLFFCFNPLHQPNPPPTMPQNPPSSEFCALKRVPLKLTMALMPVVIWKNCTKHPIKTTFPYIQESYNTPQAIPRSQLWKDSLYSLLVKVARGVFQRCVETTLDYRKHPATDPVDSKWSQMPKTGCEKILNQKQGGLWKQCCSTWIKGVVFSKNTLTNTTLRIQVCSKRKGLPLHSCSKAGIGTLNPTLGGVWILRAI